MYSLFLLAVLACATNKPHEASVASADPGAPMSAPVSQPILQTWGGTINLEMNDFGMESSGPSTVKSESEYDAFIAEIPQKRVQKRQPAPDNDDPLLKRPAIDFSSQMLVVVRSGNIYKVPEIVEVLDTGAEREVVYTIPPVENVEMLSRPMGVGRYAAALVAKTDGEVRFTRR